MLNLKYNIIWILWVFATLMASCAKENELHNNIQNNIPISQSTVIGEYNDETFHVLSLDLGKEICILTQELLRNIPYKTNEQIFEIQGKFYKATANEWDTIVQIKNTFYSFFPFKRKFEYLETAPFAIHDFWGTPSLEIGYVGRNIFVDLPKFNYFSLPTYTPKTLFELRSFLPQGRPPFQKNLSYVENDNLSLLFGTGSIINHQGVMFKINLHELNFKGKRWITVLELDNFKNMDRVFGLSENNKTLSTFNLITGALKNRYIFTETAWWSSNHFTSVENILMAYFKHNTYEKLEFINWKNHVQHFAINPSDGYLSIYSNVCHSDGIQRLLINPKKNEA